MNYMNRHLWDQINSEETKTLGMHVDEKVIYLFKTGDR